MFRIINNNKGYTLTYAIVIIAILSILTTSVIVVTYFNFKVARTSGYVNTSFYSSDGSIEEAITELNIYTHNAEVVAREYVTSELIVENNSMWVEFLAAVYDSIDVFSITYAEGNELIANAYQREFDKKFYNELFENITITNVFFDNTKTGNERFVDYGNSMVYRGIEISTAVNRSFNSDISDNLGIDIYNSGDNVITLSSLNFTAPNIFSFTLTTDGTTHKFNKKLKIEFDIITPKFDFIVSTESKPKELNKNEIADYALISNNSILFKNGLTEINGDINAFGSPYDGYTNLNRDVYNGVVFEDGNLNITGDLITRSSVVFKNTEVNLTVTGNIYANAINLQENASNINIAISDNLFLYSDLFISGDNAVISIGSSGFENSDLSDLSDTYLPNSGVIYAINNDNLELSNKYSRNGSIIISEKASNPSIALNGLVLGGTVRYNLYNRKDLFGNDIDSSKQKPFKTGEGITTFQNKEYYQTLLEDNIYQSGVFSTLQLFSSISEPDKYYDLIKYSVESVDGVEINDVKYNASHFYQMGYKAYMETGNDSLYKKISTDDKNIIKFRDLDENASNEFYGIFSLGVLSFTKEGEPANFAKTYHPDRIRDTYFTVEIREDMDEKLNFLGYRDIKFIGNANDSDTKSILYADSGWLDFSGVSNVEELSNENIVIINNDPSIGVYLNYDVVLANQIEIEETKLNGVIVSKGNIYIGSKGGAFEFTGTIVTDGNIFFEGNNKKTINYNELLIYKTIYKNEELKKLYQTTNGRALGVINRSDELGFKTSVGNNPSKIIVNIVDDSNLDASGKSLDSTSVIIKSWKEID